MSYRVRTDNFEGPFDILLYLVSRQRVDIGSISIAQIADHCEHPNGAKLFVRWICGEADGQGEGLAPFITAGSYPVFPNAPVADVEQPAFDSIPKFDLDLQYYYENYYDVYDYWVSVQP